MPAFIKTQKDEKIWSKAKDIAKNQYPDMTEDGESYWKITTAIYKKIHGGLGKKAAEKPTKAQLAMQVGGYDIPAKTQYTGAVNWLRDLNNTANTLYTTNKGSLDGVNGNFGSKLQRKSGFLSRFYKNPHMCAPFMSLVANHAFGGQPLTNKQVSNHRPVLTRELNYAFNNNSDESEDSLRNQKPLPINTKDFNWFRFSENARSGMVPHLPAAFSLVDWNRNNSREGHLGLVLPSSGEALDWGEGRAMRRRSLTKATGNQIIPTYFMGTPGAKQFVTAVNSPHYPRTPHALSFAPFPASVPADRVAFDLYNETYVPRQTAARLRNLSAASKLAASNKVPGYLLSAAGRAARVKNLMGRFAEDYKNNASYVSNLLKRPGEVYGSDLLNPMKRFREAFNYAAKFSKLNSRRVPGAAYVLPPLD